MGFVSMRIATRFDVWGQWGAAFLGIYRGRP
jgi:hypothetical protein